jgi:CheY-like chemotaxis protein
MFSIKQVEKPTEIPPVNATKAKKVLLVDDEHYTREVVQTCLETLTDWEILTASSGLEGLQKIVSHKPDGIVLDIMMPGMDGLEFLHLLHDIHGDRTIPVVLLTANEVLTQPHLLPSMRVAGAIAKPFEPSELVKNIATYLDWTLEK